jgi:hypothetical protein
MGENMFAIRGAVSSNFGRSYPVMTYATCSIGWWGYSAWHDDAAMRKRP